MLNRTLRPVALAVALTTFLSACATAPGNYLDSSRLKEEERQTPTETYPVHYIDAKLIMDQLQQQQQMSHPLPPSRFTDPSQYVYHIGPQDILGVTVWDHPELTTPQGQSFSSGGNTTQTVAGALQQPYTSALPGQADPYGQTVGVDGTIFFPFVGRVRVAGKTVMQVREELATGLARYVKNPQLDVRVLSYRSQKVQVTGEVKQPGPLALSDVPLTLVDSISRSGGSTGEADLQRVRLTRGGKLYTLDANGVLDRGDITQNVMLQPGDIVNVPDRSDSRVYIMGEVKTPVAVPMMKGRLSIADALTSGGGILDTDANPRKIYVMRGMRDNPTKPEVFRLDMTQPDALMLSSRFQLQPLDVVYVSTASSVQFNRVLQQVLPTIQTIFFMKQITR
ncbi:polysaccharide biosynthesis/export family protein [Burkholderia stagnalis]|uniref:polysaccharide biosynthesis/export family protein n=1 Tax=Burkholderia stagnalis TaxID=1503054 RepID=UPI000755B8DD|nr:polysaccharide biosynthesis/export family protein [Burkholderia stagnalis]KVM89829.1 exopolysaccharide biosynthesis protein [Burkholderia stagnalis]KVN58368.1 exopolysaccharide biosynthesis protein [Burkholderia stagnalis]KVX68090.1 exopolysaccharide biosynthesis protein [Burkholderia stagnalis]KWE12377.1 exopolysaccharide biosynthesis protein [Burkholderia stagnalis]KWE13106.1 exopolysaccharide biosynthesis protein [Burkholderia stagnalis]